MTGTLTGAESPLNPRSSSLANRYTSQIEILVSLRKHRADAPANRYNLLMSERHPQASRRPPAPDHQSRVTPEASGRGAP